MPRFLIRVTAGQFAGLFIGTMAAEGLPVLGTEYGLFAERGPAYQFFVSAAQPLQDRLQTMGLPTELVQVA